MHTQGAQSGGEMVTGMWVDRDWKSGVPTSLDCMKIAASIKRHSKPIRPIKNPIARNNDRHIFIKSFRISISSVYPLYRPGNLNNWNMPSQYTIRDTLRKNGPRSGCINCEDDLSGQIRMGRSCEGPIVRSEGWHNSLLCIGVRTMIAIPARADAHFSDTIWEWKSYRLCC